MAITTNNENAPALMHLPPPALYSPLAHKSLCHESPTYTDWLTGLYINSSSVTVLTNWGTDMHKTDSVISTADIGGNK